MRKESFNDGWEVVTSTSVVGELQGGEKGKVKRVTLPHDAMILSPRGAENPSQNSGGFFPGGDYTYTKRFFVEEERCDKTWYLEFEGIYETGMVYVNGNHVGTSHYGYTRLIMDVTQFLVRGRENTIAVKTFNSAQPNTRWYTGSGIYRPVNIYCGGELRIGVDGVKVRVKEVEKELARLIVETEVEYDKKSSHDINLCVEIMDENQNVVCREETPITLLAESRQILRQCLYLRKPLLWSVEEPYLYTCHVVLKAAAGDEEFDETVCEFGVRKIQVDPVHGLRVNGREVLLRGACIHHDNGVIGAATFYKAEERRIRLLKQAGFNAIRMSHHPASKAILEACDRLGMLVLDETFDVWTQSKSAYDYALRFAENWERDLEDLVRKDYNHPSVIMYSIGNEISDLTTKSGGAWSRRLVNCLHGLDEGRLVTNAINGLTAVEDKMNQIMLDYGIVTKGQFEALESGNMELFEGDINDLMNTLHGKMNEMAAHPIVSGRCAESYACLDVCGLNYMRGAYEAYGRNNPNRITFGSETLPPDIALNWEKVKEIPSCIGDFTWTGWDYIGESGVGVVGYDGNEDFFKPYPCYLANVGDLDITGIRRPASYFREIVFGLRKTPYLAVSDPACFGKKVSCTPWACSDAVECWTWPGHEGKPCRVEVYSATEEVEIRINGISQGRVETGEKAGYKAESEVIYQPGDIEAVGYDGGVEVERFTIDTAGAGERLELKCEEMELEKGGQDLAFVQIRILDAKGQVALQEKHAVRLTVEGAGTLLGYGSADPFSAENFYDEVRTSYQGRLLAVVRSREEAGEILVRAEADGLKEDELRIRVKK